MLILLELQKGTWGKKENGTLKLLLLLYKITIHLKIYVNWGRYMRNQWQKYCNKHKGFLSLSLRLDEQKNIKVIQGVIKVIKGKFSWKFNFQIKSFLQYKCLCSLNQTQKGSNILLYLWQWQKWEIWINIIISR